MKGHERFRLEDAVERWLGSLSESEFRLLVCRVRPPTEPIEHRRRGQK